MNLGGVYKWQYQQEEFLKQMERNQILAKARADKISEIPEVKKALEDASSGTRGLGYDSYSVACYILEHCFHLFQTIYGYLLLISQNFLLKNANWYPVVA